MSSILSPHNMTDILRNSDSNHENKCWFNFKTLSQTGISFLNKFKTRHNLNIHFAIKCPPILKGIKWRIFSDWCFHIVVETKKISRKRPLLSVTYRSEVRSSDDWFFLFKRKMSDILSPHNMTDILRNSNSNHEKQCRFNFTILSQVPLRSWINSRLVRI